MYDKKKVIMCVMYVKYINQNNRGGWGGGFWGNFGGKKLFEGIIEKGRDLPELSRFFDD